MKMKRPDVVWILACAFIGFAAHAQESTIRVDANLVMTPVLVTNAAGKAVRDLRLQEFEIEENGTRIAPVRIGEAGEAPVDLAMLFDISGSVLTHFEFERQAASSFLRRVFRDSDSVLIVSVGNQPRILQESTSSISEALEAVSAVQPTTQATAFLDSIARSMQLLRSHSRPDARKVIIALSDGEDNRSVVNRPTGTLREIQDANCLFYSINPKGQANPFNWIARRSQEMLASMARETGGAWFVAQKIEDLREFYDRIAEELQSQYLLGYYSPAKTGPGIFRRIQIQVRGRPDLTVKARLGYYPGESGRREE